MVNKVNRNIEWLVDDFGSLVGYQKSPGVEVAIPSFATDTSGNVTGLVGPGGAEVDYLAAIGGRVTSVTYSPSGQVAAYSSGGVSYTVSYDASDRVQSVTDGTAVRTVAYNANGTVASII